MGEQEQFCSSSFLYELIDRINNGSHGFITDNGNIVEGLKKVLKIMNEANEFDIREIGDYIHDGILLSDSKTKVLYVNKAYTQITGIQAEEIIGKSLDDLQRKGILQQTVTPEIVKLKKQVNSMGHSLRTGTKVLISGNPIFDGHGNVKKVVVVDRDITELIKKKEELEATQLKMKTIVKDSKKSKLEVEHLKKLYVNTNIVGESPETKHVIKLIQQVASLDTTVLITGETGVGKEVVANEIYKNSYRKDKPFIKVNCSAIPANLLEAELFGYVRGAFTGASDSGKLGMFALADNGTLLLDEIGEMPMELQPKLLRVLQSKEITPIGGTKPVKLNVRIISASNCDLKEMVTQKKFREDLYYRLNVFPIYIPPLRERKEDVTVLASYLLETYNDKYGKNATFNSAGLEMLKHYAWPGNVRELQNVIERLLIILNHGSVITAEEVGYILKIDSIENSFYNPDMGLQEIMDHAAKNAIENAIMLHGSTRKVARFLKTDQAHIVRKAKKLGININEVKNRKMAMPIKHLS